MLPASASAQFGPAHPRTNLEQRFSLGVGVRNDSTEWTYGYEVAVSRTFLDGSVYIADGWEAFARAGGANLVINDIALYRDWPRDLSSDGYQMFGSLGLRGLLIDRGTWALGSSWSASRYSAFNVSKTVEVNAFQTVYVDAPVELECAFPISWRFGGGQQFAFYGGPVVHFAYIEGDTRTHSFARGHLVSDEINALNVRDKGNLGLFLGIQGPLWRTRGRWQAEGELRDGIGGSASIYWPF